jgi:histidinol dehydrogenase
MQIIDAAQFDEYWKMQSCSGGSSAAVDALVREIIEAVRNEGDKALRRYAERFDKSSPAQFEVPRSLAEDAWEQLCTSERELSQAMELAAGHIRCFADLQKKQFVDFETEIEGGLFTGQRVIPVERAAVYVPAGRFPLFSSVLMGMIPALAAGVEEVILASPPRHIQGLEGGLPDRRILAAAALAAATNNDSHNAAKTRLRIFALGGAQAIAALALGTESVPKVNVIVGPGNKYVAAAKRMLFGEVGIDFVAGPTDVLVIAGETAGAGITAAGKDPVERIAADMLAQAEHDPDARARALVPSRELAEDVAAALDRRLAALPEESRITAGASLDGGGLIVVYRTKEEAIRIANIIAPEHLELHVEDPGSWVSPEKSGPQGYVRNYGSLFAGSLAAEVLGDYSVGINHTLPTSGSARFTGGLSVRHFLKTVTTLRCAPGEGFDRACHAAEILAKAEGLMGHAASALERRV